MAEVKEILVAVVHDGHKALIIERAADSSYDPARWEFVSAFIQEGDMVEQATERVKKETGLDVHLAKTGEPFTVDDEYGHWLVHPLLFKPVSTQIKLDRDHTGYAWVTAEQLSHYNTVRELDKNLKAFGLIGI